VRTADSTIIITNFYLAANSHEIFLRVEGREGMKGLGALQRHQLPHPLAEILDPPLLESIYRVSLTVDLCEGRKLAAFIAPLSATIPAQHKNSPLL